MEPSPPACVDIVSVLKDLVVGLAACVGAWTAYRGLNTWQQQLKGSNEYQLARRLAINAFKLRDAMQRARSPYMLAGEVDIPPEVIARLPDAELNFKALESAYTNRWKHVAEAVEALNVELLEGEAIWGEDVTEAFAPLKRLRDALFHTIGLHLRSNDPSIPEGQRQMNANLLKENFPSVLTKKDDPEQDTFTTDLQNAIRKVEEFLKPHLKR